MEFLEERLYTVKVPANIELEYDRQNDILYIYFGDERVADEEVLSEDGDIALGFKDGKLVFLEIMRFSDKIGGFIL
ncbi:MAG: DUF2283 domain-containing protein [Desulfurococcaceae archaeon]